MRSTSLKRQLLSWLILPYLLSCFIAGFGAYSIALHLTQRAYDDGLEDSLRALASKIRVTNKKLILDMSPEALQTLSEDSNDVWYYEMGIPNEASFAFNHSIPNPKKPSEEIQFYDAVVDGVSLRVASHSILIASPDAPPFNVTIKVAESTRGRNAIVGNSLKQAIPLLLSLTVITLIATRLGLKRVLAPLDRLQEAIASRSVDKLTPLTIHQLQNELIPLVDALNKLLERLNQEVESQRGFLSDAAHTLRTSLAGIKVQAELGSRASQSQTDLERFDKINQAVKRMSRFVSQLLELARTERKIRDSKPSTLIHIAPLVREVIQDFQPRAAERDISLILDNSLSNDQLLGSQSSVQTILENLLDNALLYTPERGSIVVALESASDAINIIVEDTGCGIPPEERHLVTTRFYRAKNAKGDGSGLGLSIVREIVDGLSGKMRIEVPKSGAGTRIIISLPVG